MAVHLADTNPNISLYDVDDYRSGDSRVRQLPFVKIPPSPEPSYDTVMALTVLHHCDDPEYGLERIFRLAKRRVIIIESLAGRVMDWPTQFLVDWIYNRGFHPNANIPVPGNFMSEHEWRVLFAQHDRWHLFYDERFGIDTPEIVPEDHHLFVLEKRG